MKNNNKLLACPYIIWMILFTIIPLGIVFYYALTDSITGQFTLANLSGMGTYLPIFLRSIWLSLFASLICLIIGYPVAYFIAQCKPLTQRFLEMLIMLPMCMSFLLRTLAWVGMLEDTGIINTLLQRIGIGPRAHAVNARQIRALARQPPRVTARRPDQLAIFDHRAIGQSHLMCLAIDRDDFTAQQ